MLYLMGYEEVNFGSRAKQCGRAQIIYEKFPIAKWTEGNRIQVGQYAFPFEINLPDWLPASLGLVENEKAILMSIKYRLVAQIEGHANHSIINRLQPELQTLNMTYLRHERPFMVTRHCQREPVFNIE